jgi:hypothetical protein
VAILAMVIGIGSMLGGITVVTPDDAILPDVPVRGPLSMYAQSEW